MNFCYMTFFVTTSTSSQYGHLFDTLDILLVGEDKTYEFIEKMIQTVATTFKSKKDQHWYG